MKRTATLVLCAALSLIPAAATANFLETELGARPMGMGGAFVAVADDVTAVHWNPAGLASLERVEVFGMRTSVYGVDGLSEDAALVGYGNGRYGAAVGWMRTGARDLYNEDTIVAGYGYDGCFLEGLSAGIAFKRLSIDAPGYDYYNDPAFRADGDAAFTADLGWLYRRGSWTLGGTFRNLGEPELQLLDTTESTDPVLSELRLGGSYLFRGVMLMAAEWRVPRDAPTFYDEKASFNMGTEIWFYDAFALRAGMNRDRITAGVGIKSDNIRLDVALLSERRIGSLYRLSAMFVW